MKKIIGFLIVILAYNSFATAKYIKINVKINRKQF